MASSSKSTAGRKTGAAAAGRDSIHVSRFNRNHTLADFTEACKTRTVLVERKFKEALLISIGFRFHNDLQRWNWWNLIRMRQDVLVNAVRMF